MLKKELKVLKEYINVNKVKGHIRPLITLIRSLILFILKKDSSL
jgi:pantothenate kinase